MKICEVCGEFATRQITTEQVAIETFRGYDKEEKHYCKKHFKQIEKMINKFASQEINDA